MPQGGLCKPPARPVVMIVKTSGAARQDAARAWDEGEENRSWETEAEPVDIPEEDGIIEAAGKPPVVNKIPENPSVTGHIFKKGSGHIPDTPENRALLEAVANQPECFSGTDIYGNNWYGKVLEDGRQVWSEVRGGVIFDGGVNQEPIFWNPKTGYRI